jgi:hypothetical protein
MSWVIEMGAQNKVNRKVILQKQAVLLFALLLSLAALSVTDARATTQISIIAFADSYVDSSYPDANYGNSIFLYTHNWNHTEDAIGPIAYAWLKFDLSEIPSQATINSIILRMHTAMWGTRSINPVGVFVCDDNSWTESGITWNNAPSLSSTTSLHTVNVGDPDINYDFNLTYPLKGKLVLSLVLQTIEPAKQPAVFNSKDLSNGPTLLVEYSIPVDTSLIAIVGIGLIVIVTVLGVFIFRLRKKKK